MYKENPKTAGSGIVCCIPQTGECPQKCSDCFFQSGRSYLEPLDENLPNMPDMLEPWQVLRVNDGNDSNVRRQEVMEATKAWEGRRFFNTSFARPFHEPWVLTVNPSDMTDAGWHKLDEFATKMLMFVRVRTNVWNLGAVVRDVVDHYTGMSVPVVLTFMAYYNDEIPEEHKTHYEFRKRTLNSYWVIKMDAWKRIIEMFDDNPLVHSCSGPDNFKCRNCGTCLREFHAVVEGNK